MPNDFNLDFLEYDFKGKKLFIVEDHPTALLCWIKAFKDEVLKKNSNLIHVDKHSDFTFQDENIEKSINLLSMNYNDIESFINEDLDEDHSEFIVNAMYSELIKDGITFNYENGGDYGKVVESKYHTTLKNCFIDENELEHNFYFYPTPDISNLFGTRSVFGDDHLVHKDTESMFYESEDMILDIDLDFFTYEYHNYVFPKHIDDIKFQLVSESFKSMISRSTIVTVALEPDFCGNNRKYSLQIFDQFNELIFKPNGLDIINDVSKKFF